MHDPDGSVEPAERRFPRKKEMAVNGKKKLIVGGVVAGGLMIGAAGLVLGAGIAKADFHQDVQFMELLDQRGIALTNNDTSWGTGVCNGLDEGFTPKQEVDAVSRNSMLTTSDAIWFVVSAENVYCHRHFGQDYFTSQPLMHAPRFVPPPVTQVPNDGIDHDTVVSYDGKGHRK
jgi:hypothetical protein